jgi:Skp family chaperone for outer membrane proteins
MFKRSKNIFIIALIGLGLGLGIYSRSRAIEIPLESLSPVRIGYIDMQRVFDTYPEKSFAEGDLLREIEKRKRELSRRQADINSLRQQLAVDNDALTKARGGLAITVPANAIPEPVAEPVKVAASTTSVTTSSGTSVATSTTPVVEPYPTDDPLAGLPGHDSGGTAASAAPLPGLQGSTPAPSELDLLASATGPVLLTPSAITALEKRIDRNQRRLNKNVADFKTFRGTAVDDMKQLQTQKTYGVMAKIYAVLEDLAREEGITVVLDKAYVLYGEDTVDLSDKLISRLQVGEQ